MTEPQDLLDNLARAAFYAGLPRGAKGDLVPGHTEWDDLGPKTQQRYHRMAAAVVQGIR